ncbi:hypothetical protein DTO013E5_6582 [Penicillium roqueforti]|uniref:uncharacterized protein n=1 Tax=Penicillium roqueforti TaxID=5082 RepID=UPI00190C3A42|nr:uncharacterized protein LCP9604111_6754 [Penicillium roqueforti]KAF9246082.1 hypothetical protein LCP9604111_6754 [Penicillium roqueforti]KAI1834442.1 hypothetical protein CBS147337_4732 [Penicillium roqueforti]KAI2686032.1 hypothetical protein CBS147355_1519 [Penicillium roqueforti]KAI2692249.1 hypothetical protein LCP963914a_343 [Penicillium roqueforti]KAI2717849.1 hypothetical protein CBS147318_4426 [Penicillium roqueforti]
MRQHIRPSVGLRSPGPAFSRRCFASEKPSGQAKNPRWLLVSIGLGLPISIYLWQRGDTKKPSSKPHTQPRGANQEYSQESEATQAGVQNIKSGSSGGDVPRGMGAPNGPGSISAKQEGLSNADTMNPYVNEPGYLALQSYGTKTIFRATYLSNHELVERMTLSGAPVRRGTKVSNFSPNAVYFTSPTFQILSLKQQITSIKIYFIKSSTMNGHAACPKCGVAADGTGKSCGACGATCPV